MSKKQKKFILSILIYIIIISLFVAILLLINKNSNKYQTKTKSLENNQVQNTNIIKNSTYDVENIPEFTGEAYIYLNNNIPNFKEEEYTTKSFEYYSELDSLGRCGTAYANVGSDLMPTEKRSSIGNVKPTGWHSVKYELVPGKYLYNRCHLIGYQLTSENANKKNLITCTKYMNNTGMLEFENQVAEYVKETNNHVLYRVTPFFKNNNLLASGVEIEAYSVEDHGKGIKFNVYVYNAQKGIDINYTDGSSKLAIA